ncbi:MAG: hypothetical protein WB993_17510 [Candidatus Sulfotelmatobacter sp.]
MTVPSTPAAATPRPTTATRKPKARPVTGRVAGRKPKPVTLADVKFTDAQGRKLRKWIAQNTPSPVTPGASSTARALYDQEKAEFPMLSGKPPHVWNAAKNAWETGYWFGGTCTEVRQYIKETTVDEYEKERKLDEVEHALDGGAA